MPQPRTALSGSPVPLRSGWANRVLASAAVLMLPVGLGAQEFECGVASNPGAPMPVPEYQHAEAAARADCRGTCVVDVAFSYSPDAIDGSGTCTGDPNTHCSRRSASASELRQYLTGALVMVNGAFQNSGVDVVEASLGK